jgi:thiamine-phosphate diphosphorylase
MDLPRLCLVADRFVDERVADRVVEAVEAGVSWVQLRAHDYSDETFRGAAIELAERLREIHPTILISINSRLEVARELRAAFHAGRHGTSPDDARSAISESGLVGSSVHSIDEAIRAWKSGVDYVIFSPIYDTLSKPEAVAVGPEALGAVVRAVSPLPVLALGGITSSRAREILFEGAHGAAVLSGILDASDVQRAVADYLDALDEQ